MKKLIFVAIAALLMTSCLKETAHDTLYVLHVSEQTESGGDYVPLGMTKAFAFAGTTEEWEIESFDHADVGIITSKLTGEECGPIATAQPYAQNETSLSLALDRESVIIVAVDPATKVYAYTDYTVPQNFPEVFVDIVFRPWKTESYTASTWTFMVPATETTTEPEDQTITE